MHECIMVKVGGKRNTHKVCKKASEFLENRGEFEKVWRNNNFRESGGEMGKIGKGEIRNLWSMTKKWSREILAEENGNIFREKGYNF